MRKSIRERFDILEKLIVQQREDIIDLECKLRDKTNEVTRFVNNRIEFQMDHLGSLKNRLRAACDSKLEENNKEFQSIKEAFENVHNTIDFIIKSPPKFKVDEVYDNFTIKDISAVLTDDDTIEYQYFIEDAKGLEMPLNGFLTEKELTNLSNRKTK